MPILDVNFRADKWVAEGLAIYLKIVGIKETK
jgi:hypothetical protein